MGQARGLLSYHTPSMKTVVYQSYRTRDVAPWLATCQASVRDWAARAGHDYRHYGDELFDRVPDWYRAKAGSLVLPVSDLARLVLARELLAEGYDRTVWVDADLLVFDLDLRIEAFQWIRPGA